MIMWCLTVNLMLDLKVRLPLNLLNSLIFMLCCTAFTAKKYEQVPEITNDLKTHLLWPVTYTFFICVMTEGYRSTVVAQFRIRLNDVYQMINLQQEYHLILESLDSSIITLSDTNIKYFNQAGQQLLGESIRSSSDEVAAATCQNEMEAIRTQISLKKTTKTNDEARKETQELIMSQQFFKIFLRNRKKVAAEEQGSYSFKQLLQMDHDALNQIIFQKLHVNQQELNDEQPKNIYFTVVVKKLTVNNHTFVMLKIDDTTISVHFDLSKGEKKILQLVNACVSHEMRNPLNSILAQNIKLKQLVFAIRQWIADRHELPTNLVALADELEDATVVQESCTKLLTFYVEDLLCLA